MSQFPETSDAAQPILDAESVKSFFQQNPDFLQQNPDLLSLIETTTAADNTSSLVHLQMKKLRSENQQLRQQLNELVEIANTNQTLADRLFNLAAELIGLTSSNASLQAILELVEAFIPHSSIRLTIFDDDKPTSNKTNHIAPDSEQRQLFESLLKTGNPLCGRLREQQLTCLFGDDSSTIQSAAALAMRVNDYDMILAFGSEDEATFSHNMATDYLQYIGRLVSPALSPLL